MPNLFDIIVTNKTIKAAITDDCTILTVIDYANPGGLDVKEHASFVEAMKYLDRECVDGHWDRVYILNAGEVRARGEAKGGG